MVFGRKSSDLKHRLMVTLSTLIITVIFLGIFALTGNIPEAAADTTKLKSDSAVNSGSAGLPTFTNEAYAGGGLLSLDVRGADLKDILSALAIKMGVNIILLDTETIEINFKVENITPRLAMELIVQSKGLAYLQKGDIIVVGEPGTLEENFFDQMILTRFDTTYIKVEKLKQMLYELGIKGIKSITADTNPHVIWVQGTAEGMKKVQEVITAVDISEEPIMEEEQSRFVYQLTYIVANDAADRLEKFGFEDVKTIATDGDRYGHELMVICPKKIETQIKSALNGLDMPRKKTKAPLATEEGEYSHEKLVALRDVLSQLSDVSSANISISRNIGSRDNPKHVLWAEETPDKIRLLKDLVAEMKSDAEDN